MKGRFEYVKFGTKVQKEHFLANSNLHSMKNLKLGLYKSTVVAVMIRLRRNHWEPELTTFSTLIVVLDQIIII